MRIRRSIARVASLLIVLVLFAGLIVPVVPAAAAGLTVAKQSATVDFPKTLEFDLVADAPQPATMVEVWYHPTYSPVTQVSRPTFSGGTHIDVKATIDMQVNYLPPGLDIVYRWRVTLKDGTILETPQQTVLYMDTRFQWSNASSGPVTVYYPKGQDQLGQQALSTTVQSITKFEQTFKISTVQPFHVVVYGSNSEFASALPPNSAEWIGGIAEPQLHLVLTGIQPGSGSATEVSRILSHESVHIVVGQVTNNPFNTPPPWLDEGLATYYQDVQDPRFPPALKNAVQSGQLIPVRALNSSFPDDPNQALLSYAESESIVDYIITQLGPDKMSALLQAFKGGVSYEQAVETGLGMTIDQLDMQWKAWLGYGGDKQISATIDTNHGGPGIGQQINDLLATSVSILWIGLAALLCLVAGTVVIIRSHRSHGDPLDT